MNANNVYEMFYQTLEPMVFPITGMLNGLGKTVADIEEIYFGLKENRDDPDDDPAITKAWLKMTVGNGIAIDETNGTMIIKVQNLDFTRLEKEGTYEACFGIKFTGDEFMSEERITLTKDKKAILRVYIAKDSVRS